MSFIPYFYKFLGIKILIFCSIEMQKQRDISIDILKFIAAIAITNSHMGLLYGDYSALATGGAIGDGLFFFASGYTLFLGRMGRFDNWYKRRINRIYPTVFAWAALAAACFGRHNDMIYTLIHGGGWFVTCIMIYYVVLYMVRWRMMGHLKLAFLLAAGVVMVWYVAMDPPFGFNIYGGTYFKWGHYFLFMLLGAMIGVSGCTRRFSLVRDGIKLVGCIVAYYGMLVVSRRIGMLQHLELASLIPLLGIVYYLYKLCNSSSMKRLYYNRYTGAVIRFVGGLCLEIYLVQYSLFTDKMNNLFPLNLFVMFLIIVAVAYVLRCLARVFQQTFRTENYQWQEVFKPW